MENFRQRLMAQDAQLYPNLHEIRNTQQQPRSVITISSSPASSSASASSSSSSSSSNGPRPFQARKAIVISSDEEDEDDVAPLKPSNADNSRLSHPPNLKPIKPLSPTTNDGSRKISSQYSTLTQTKPHQPTMPIPRPYQQPPKTIPMAMPIRSADVNTPIYPEDKEDGEVVKMPVIDDGNVLLTSADADKALRDLMNGNMNEDVDVDVNPEDAVVDGFKEGFTLLSHQIVGRKWMKEREDPAEKRFGGILADDMGLGKTIQTLTRIVEGRPKKRDKEDGWSPTTLVVCPLALVGQWASEIERMAKGLVVVKHQGTSRSSDPKALQRAHVVVTTYDTIKSEFGNFRPPAKDVSQSKAKKKQAVDDTDSSEGDHFGRTLAKDMPKKSKAKAPKDALFRVKWFRVVLDEAHNIKNRNTNGAIACCELEAKFRWALTGTPMQNDVTELFTLFKFLKIKPFNAWDRFNEQIAKPIKNGNGASRAMKRLQVVLRQVMLRRRKDDTLNGKVLIELPARNINIVSCDFSPSEQEFYSSLEVKMGDVMDKLMRDAERSGKNANYMSVLLLLLRLRQACNHPCLVSKDYKEDLEAVDSQAAKKGSNDVDGDDLVAAFGKLGVTRKCSMCTTELTPSNNSKVDGHCDDCSLLAAQARRQTASRPDSAKIRKILELLKEVEEKSEGEDKTIIFSQFTSMLDLIQPFLRDHEIRFVRYDGTMNSQDRERSIEVIKKDSKVKVILISFKAGSTGLNLTCCNNVILVDLWWNPALEDQAFDRAHRFGQRKDVNIYKLKIDNTVEERILELQEKKRELARAALSGDKIKNMRLGMDDLLALFRPGAHDEDDD